MARLTPEEIINLSDPIVQVYNDVVDSLLINIAKHFNTGKGLSTQEWEIKKLSELGQLNKESVEIIANLTGQSPDLVKVALENAVTSATRDVEPELKKAVKKGAIKAASAENVIASESIKQALTSYDLQAVNKLNLVNTTMLESTQDLFRNIVTNTANIERQMQAAQQILNTATGKVITGAESRTQALRKALADVHKEGITGFYDRAGRKWSPEAYISMDMRTTMHNTAIEAIKLRQEDYGVSIFRVSTHSGARPLCYPYQGRYFSWNNTSGTFTDGEGKRHRYSPLSSTSYGKPAGLFGINCDHHPITVIPGVSIPRDRTEQDKEENDKAYAESQEQRRLEREIRYAKQKASMMDAAGDKEGFTKEAAKIKQKQADYNAFCKRTGRTKRLDRTQVFDYNKDVGRRATVAVKKAEAAKKAREEAKQKEREEKKAEIRALIKSDATPKKLNPSAQNKHIRSSKGYLEGRSYLYGDAKAAQKLVDQYAGTGEPKFAKKTGEWNQKEVVVANEDIGVVIDPETGKESPTNRFVIHYSKKGTHIVPTRRNDS